MRFKGNWYFRDTTLSGLEEIQAKTQLNSCTRKSSYPLTQAANGAGIDGDELDTHWTRGESYKFAVLLCTNLGSRFVFSACVGVCFHMFVCVVEASQFATLPEFPARV